MCFNSSIHRFFMDCGFHWCPICIWSRTWRWLKRKANE